MPSQRSRDTPGTCPASGLGLGRINQIMFVCAEGSEPWCPQPPFYPLEVCIGALHTSSVRSPHQEGNESQDPRPLLF